MPLLQRTKYGQYIFGAGKYVSLSLDEIAKRDPGYLTWMWSKLPDFQLEAEVVNRLEDTMWKKGIPFK